MPFPIRTIDMDELTVVDVYELASEIGKEFEIIIERFGSEFFTGLMPKVVSALEHLEAFAARSERDVSQLGELKATIHRLEVEKIGKAEDKERFEKELEQIEENWRTETRDLLELVSKLKEENRKLSSSLAEKEEERGKDGSHDTGCCSHDQDIKVLTRMKELIDQQRDQIRQKDKELNQGYTDVEGLQSQVERLTQVNKDLRRKNKATQSQTRGLIDDKAELQATLQEQQRVLQVMKQSLGVAQKDNDDLAKAKSLELNLMNKVVYDADDPDRPRFTMTELKNVLFERNELKAKVSELEDELDYYRPKPNSLDPLLNPDDSPTTPTAAAAATGGDATTTATAASSSSSRSTPMDELPVQGPINREPDDAPWKKQESSIRKLYVQVLKFPQQLLEIKKELTTTIATSTVAAATTAAAGD